MRKNIKGYNIGLDIGTGSVGYAVTDMDGNNIKIKGKNMWGVNLFESAETAASTRAARGMRRRYDRRRQRILLLRQFFIDNKELDISFFEKLDNSYLSQEKNGDNLFSDDAFNDRIYYENYKTIYHLRKALQTSKKKEDIRLVYLALHHIVKYRGNFLYEDNPNLSAENANLSDAINLLFTEIENVFNESYDESTTKEFEAILNDSTQTRRDKAKGISNILGTGIPGKGIGEALLGLTTNFSAIFNPNAEPIKFSISNDEKREEYLSALDDSCLGLYDALYRLNSALVLKNILSFGDKQKGTLSDAVITRYKEYGEDLQLLKYLIKDYCKENYKWMFSRKNANEKNYTAYDLGSNKCTIEELYTSIRTIFPENDDKEYNNDSRYLTMKTRMERGEFLKKINSTDNGAIPYQLHLEELRNILDNQGKYYPFLIENKEKIEKLVSFRLPYWCGPLNAQKNPAGSRQFAWSVRKEENVKVYPWNFDDVIDVDKTAEKFITTLTNYCTYLPQEKVLPKNSLLFTEYALRNEIFSITIKGKHLDPQIRRDLYDEFCKGKNSMTTKELANWLTNEKKINTSPEDIKGFQGDNKFASNMKSYNDFTRILGDISKQYYYDVELMIYYLTVYNDKRIIRRRLTQEFPYLTQKQISEICGLKYSGWAPLSKRLLDGIYIIENGKIVTIINKMRTGKYNFMQVINEKGFRDAIEEESYNTDGDINNIIDNLAGSPALKKGIRQSIRVINELVSIMGGAPDNIFVEFAREDQESLKTENRRKKLLDAYEAYKNNPDFVSTYKYIKSSDDKDFDDRMIYLYCLQNGKCMYSGKQLDISSLSKTCQVDHILPRCYIKDDSFDNLALVLSSENQRKKDSLLLEDSIISSQYQRWTDLKNAGLISDKKFNNLTRKAIVSSDAKRFINRQLVETRQITKHVANILKEIYSPMGTSIVQIKAGLSSDLRQKYELFKNRDINDYHHAHDAYLACQIGIFLQKCMPGVYKDFDFTTAKHYFALKDASRAQKNKYGFIIGRFDEMYTDNKTGEVIWDGEDKVCCIINALKYKDCFIAKKTEKQSGKFYKDTIYPKTSKEAKIPIKKGLPVELYGGHTGSEEAYSVIIEYTKGKKRYKKLVGIPIIIDALSQANPNAITEYLTNQGYKDLRIAKFKVCKYQKILIDGNEYYISSSSEVHNARQLVLSDSAVKVISNPTDNDDIKLNDVFNTIREKIDKYYPGYASVNQKLEQNKKAFEKLDIKSKSSVIRQMLIMLHANPSNANLKQLNMTDREGRKAGYNLNIDNTVFVTTSVTGIFENRIEGKLL